MKSKKVKNLGKRKVLIGALLFIAGYGIFSIVNNASAPEPSQPQMSQQKSVFESIQATDSDSNAEIIDKSVAYIKNTMALPLQLNETASIVDVTAENNAIRFHGLFTGSDGISVATNNMKAGMAIGLCRDKEMASLLDRGISLEYSFVGDDTSQEMLVAITKQDCIS